MPRLPQNLGAVRKTGQTVVTTTATPLTKIGDTSGAGTTFTAVTVIDGAAWDLSAVSVGDVAVSADGYKGVITEVDDAADTVTVNYWLHPDGRRGGLYTTMGVAIKPTDGQTVTIHRISRCKNIGVKALSGNTDGITIGRNGTAVATDYPLSPGRKDTLTDENKLDVTEIYVRADSGSQTVAWIVGAAIGG